MKKILYVASTYGHIISFHIPYIKKLQKMGFKVHVAAANMPEHSEALEIRKTTENQEPTEALNATEPVKPAEIRKINLPFEKSMLSPKNLACTAQLVKLLKQEHYDIISVHTSLAAFFVRLAVMFTPGKKPTVINTVHGYLFDEGTSFIKRNILLCAEKLTKPATDILVVMNQQDYDIAQKHKLYRDKLIKIPGVGIDTERFSRKKVEEDLCRQAERAKLGIGQDDIVMIYAAEFSKRKNQKMLIEAMAKLPTNVKLFLAGKGDQLEECQRTSEQLRLNKVMFIGHVKNLEHYYHIADICVSSSRSEGLPFNVMEAMSMGLPVIATNVKGHQDLIEQDVNGYLYEYDAPNGFVDAVMQLINGMKTESSRNKKIGLDATISTEAMKPIDAETKIAQGQRQSQCQCQSQRQCQSQSKSKYLEISQNNTTKAQRYSLENVMEEVLSVYEKL